MVNKYEKLSAERKSLQAKGLVPDWYTTAGYQLFMEKYTLPGQTLHERYQQIAEAAGTIADELYPREDASGWREHFFQTIWDGWLSPATPVLTNLGLSRGTPVSCSGLPVDDSVSGFYKARYETAMLTKNGFGTSAYMGNVRPRGSDISTGGKTSGALPVIRGFVQDMGDVSQGNTRRGAWAGYLEIEHGDFNEVCDYLYNNPDNFNMGWIVTDAFLERLNQGDADAIARYKKVMKTRTVTGKGYMFFRDKANRAAPEELKKHGLTIHASNLCSEIALPSDENHTFTCVLSSMNAAKYDEWKDTDAVQTAVVFLDSVAEAFMRQAREIEGMEKAVRFTEKSRALGLGVLGFHTYVQQNGWALDDMRTSAFNWTLFRDVRTKALEASKWMAGQQGSPEWVDGRRNLTLLAVAPNMSTATICGGVSQGIEPVVANVYNQGSQAGEIERINPVLLDLMKARGVYSKATIWDLIDNRGSVQHVTWLDDDEKRVFRTAFEVDQKVLLRLASQRQRWIDQGQSLNLFFSAEEDPRYISQVHRAAAEDPGIKALYYMRSQAGVQASKGDCMACEG
ncbi:ribonucleoside-diphosphate reductase subunit alpha [Streptomyces sp. NPDC002120]|uniref:ribonucleoside-diphosphate reductase subunit alpha n=1 Tax=Streptomyces sp. NPDC002120 TaxID=3364631 RepID=UPI0036B9821D